MRSEYRENYRVNAFCVGDGGDVVVANCVGIVVNVVLTIGKSGSPKGFPSVTISAMAKGWQNPNLIRKILQILQNQNVVS